MKTTMEGAEELALTMPTKTMRGPTPELLVVRISDAGELELDIPITGGGRGMVGLWPQHAAALARFFARNAERWEGL